MNDALNFYENNMNIWSISGYSFSIKIPKKYNKEIKNPTQVSELREKAGISNIPQLIIYRIYGKSEVTKKNDKDIRENMNFGSDIIGIQICVPGEQYNSNFRKKLTIYLPEKNIEDEVEDNA